MPEGGRSTCKRCGEPIRWAVTPNDKKMPIDVEPVQRVVLIESIERGLHGYLLSEIEQGGSKVEIVPVEFRTVADDELPLAVKTMAYTVHFDTCRGESITANSQDGVVQL